MLCCSSCVMVAVPSPPANRPVESFHWLWLAPRKVMTCSPTPMPESRSGSTFVSTGATSSTEPVISKPTAGASNRRSRASSVTSPSSMRVPSSLKPSPKMPLGGTALRPSSNHRPAISRAAAAPSPCPPIAHCSDMLSKLPGTVPSPSLTSYTRSSTGCKAHGPSGTPPATATT